MSVLTSFTDAENACITYKVDDCIFFAQSILFMYFCTLNKDFAVW